MALTASIFSLQAYMFALDGGTEIAENARKTTSAIAQGWDTVWQQTIVNPPVNGSYSQVGWVARWVATIGCMIFIFNRATKLFEGGDMSAALFSHTFTYFLVPIFIWVGISNNGVVAANISYGINRVILFSNEAIMQTQIAETTFGEAVMGMQLTSLAQNELRQKYQDCMNLKDQPPPAPSNGEPVALNDVLENNPQFQCFRDLRDNIAVMQADFARRNCEGIKGVACTGVFRLFQETGVAIAQGLEDAGNQINNEITNKSTAEKAVYFFRTNVPLMIAGAVGKHAGDYLAGGAIHDWLKPVLYAFQFDYTNTLIGGMFLSGMSAPIALAASLIPFSPRTIWAWLIAFFSFGMAVFYYTILIGTVASLIVSAKAETFTALQYAFFLGLFAPAISSLLALGGAWVAARAAQANGQAIAAASFSVASSAIMSFMRFLPLK